MSDSANKVNVVEIMKKIHLEADDLYGKDYDESTQTGGKKRTKSIDFRKILKLEGKDFVDEVYLEVFERSADDKEMENALNALGSGKSKDSFIRDIMNSDEADSLQINYFGLKEYDISDLTKYEGIAFVNNLYFKLLMRTPDASGAQRHLYRLKSRAFSKQDLIWVFLNSEEGQKAGVRVNGLSSKKILIKRVLRKNPLYNRIFEFRMAMAIASDQAQELHELRVENDRIKEELESLKSSSERHEMLWSRRLENIEALLKEDNK